jgi:type VI secretion system secreted protein VgrG
MSPLQVLLGGRQHDRLLVLSFPHDDGPRAELLVERLRASEYLSKDFQYTVELLSDDPEIALHELQGKLLCVSVVRADGGLRHFTGHVATFRHVKNDGGVAFYEAVLVPWLHYLRLRQNNRLFHKQTLQQQVSTILDDHAAVAHWEWKVTGEQPEFTMCTQWAEHDHNYVHARLEAAGYTYRWEHTEDGHQWVVWDDTRTVDPIDGALPTIRFHTDAGSQEEHAVSQWSPRRQAVSAHTAVSGFDFKHPQPVMADVPSVNQQGDVPSLEVYQYEGHYGFKNQAGAEQLVRERIEAIEARGLQFDAEGNNACVKPGRWFKLVEHTGYSGEDAEFLILEAHHEASNNYLQDQESRHHAPGHQGRRRTGPAAICGRVGQRARPARHQLGRPGEVGGGRSGCHRRHGRSAIDAASREFVARREQVAGAGLAVFRGGLGLAAKDVRCHVGDDVVGRHPRVFAQVARSRGACGVHGQAPDAQAFALCVNEI